MSLENIQYLEFSPSKDETDGWTKFVYLKNNDLFLQKIPLNTDGYPEISQNIPLTNTGATEKIFNGKPDWVYEEEVIGNDKMFYWSPNGKYLAYTVLDDSNVKHIEYQTYGDETNIYPEMT